MESFDAVAPVLGLTLRGLLSRRRIVLMVLLSFSPVLIAVLVRLAGRDADPTRIEVNVLDGLVVRTVMPLVALVLGTAAMGTEIDDGTAVYLLTKPIPRWTIVAAKLLAAAGLTAALVVPAVILTGGILAGDQPGGARIDLAYAAATAVGSLLYASVFLALSLATGRALILGLVYTLLWEGVLASLFAGSRAFSIREYTLGIASLLDPDRIKAPIDLATTFMGTVGVLVVAFLLATRWLSTYQLRAAE